MHGVVAHDVVHVAVQQDMRVQRDVDLGECGADVLFGVEIDSAELLFDSGSPGLGQMHVAAIGVGVVMHAGLQRADQPDDLQPRLLAVAGSGQHQRDQRLVDQHRVGFVDQGDVRVGRHQVVDIGHQLIAQHVEADLVDRRVGDVALVCRATLLGARFTGHPADGDAQRLQQRTHPLGVAAGQIVVDGHDVNVPTAQRVAGRGDRSGQRLALTGCHFDDVTGQHPQRAE